MRSRRWLIRCTLLTLAGLACQSCRPDAGDVLHPTPENVPANPSRIVDDMLPRDLSPAALERWREARDALLAASARLWIGSDQEGPELFGRVRDVSIDDAGNILVLDEQTSDVRVFSSNGRHLQIVQTSRLAPSEREPSSVRTYLVDMQTGSGALISDEMGHLLAVSADGFVFLHNHPFPRLEVRDR